MKKTTMTLAACLSMLCAACLMGNGNATANDIRDNASNIAVAAQDSDLFIQLNQLDQSSDAKFSESLIAADNDQSGDAKCFYWYTTYPCAYTYVPTYYYYTYYCPVYYVNFRLVTYTVPVIETPVVTTTSCVTTTYTTYYKATGKTRTGAVIDSKIPGNSPLAKLGLRSGDIVTSVDGRPVTSISDVKAATTKSKLTFYRGGKIKVASKGILQNGTSASRSVASKGAETECAIAANALRNQGEMSMYEYYDRIEAANVNVD